MASCNMVNKKSGIIHAMKNDEDTYCRAGLNADTVKIGSEVITVNNMEAYAKITCKRCIRTMKGYITYAFQEQYN